MNTATKVKNHPDWVGAAAVYRLDPPYRGDKYVVASAITLPEIPGLRKVETMVFASTEDGKVADFEDLAMVPDYSHTAALASIGYEIETNAAKWKEFCEKLGIELKPWQIDYLVAALDERNIKAPGGER